MNQSFKDEVEHHFNEPVLMGFDLARVIGYAEDNDDCYIIVQYPGKDRVIYNSMVGGYTFLDRLKGQDACVSSQGKQWDDFIRLDLLLENNNCPRAEKFILKIEE